MTPPPVDAALRQRSARPALAPSPQRGRRLGVAVPQRSDWCCENCEQPNAARRRRCVDCGTSRD